MQVVQGSRIFVALFCLCVTIHYDECVLLCINVHYMRYNTYSIRYISITCNHVIVVALITVLAFLNRNKLFYRSRVAHTPVYVIV